MSEWEREQKAQNDFGIFSQYSSRRIYLTLLSDNYAIHLKQKLLQWKKIFSFPLRLRNGMGGGIASVSCFRRAKTILISNFCVLLCEHNSGFNSTYIYTYINSFTLQGSGMVDEDWLKNDDDDVEKERKKLCFDRMFLYALNILLS